MKDIVQVKSKDVCEMITGMMKGKLNTEEGRGVILFRDILDCVWPFSTSSAVSLSLTLSVLLLHTVYCLSLFSFGFTVFFYSLSHYSKPVFTHSTPFYPSKHTWFYKTSVAHGKPLTESLLACVTNWRRYLKTSRLWSSVFTSLIPCCLCVWHDKESCRLFYAVLVDNFSWKYKYSYVPTEPVKNKDVNNAGFKRFWWLTMNEFEVVCPLVLGRSCSLAHPYSHCCFPLSLWGQPPAVSPSR